MVGSPSERAASSRCKPSISTKRSPSARTLIGTCWPSLSMLAASSATRSGTKVAELAASMLKDGQQVPIKVRSDGERFVLIEGLHRLEAARSLGEPTINGYRVDARKH